MDIRYNHISLLKENVDSYTLIDLIKKDNWIKKGAVIVNCSPDYSSRLSQLVNHKLSFINDNELFDRLDLEMPYPINSQIWDPKDEEYKIFDAYIAKWARVLDRERQYLFIDSATLRGKNFSKVKSNLKMYLPDSNYKFASLYLQSNSIFKPDYYVESFDKEKQGGLIFEWENSKNPNWDY